jgi:hypothetical protein
VCHVVLPGGGCVVSSRASHAWVYVLDTWHGAVAMGVSSSLVKLVLSASFTFEKEEDRTEELLSFYASLFRDRSIKKFHTNLEDFSPFLPSMFCLWDQKS